MMPALKQHDYDWPDTPRENVYKAREAHKQWLEESGATVETVDAPMAEYDRERGI